jgi:hypothetical protein
MSNLRVGRAPWLVPLLLLTTPIILPLWGRDRSKAAKVPEQVESPEVIGIINHIIATEKQYGEKLKEFSPRVETYVQYYQPDKDLGDVTIKDDHFLGRLAFEDEAKQVSFYPDSIMGWFRRRPGMLRAHLNVDDFGVEPLMVDKHNFDRQHYTFEPVRWEYLGDVRCLAIDLKPKEHAGAGAFEGRIWVEDHDYAIVRLNGTRVNAGRWKFYVHFDCWRENLQPGLWLPVYMYSQESDIGKRLRYKAETRLWGYDLTAHKQQQEWTNIQIDAPAPIRDSTEATSDMSPLESQRQLTIDAEHNVLDRLEKARLIAPPGPVDKVLETVVSNLKVTNHLGNMPPLQCRVMLTSSLESFSLAYTIVLSRGLIDVLPDEASLAMVLAHELAHIALGHKLNTKYAFNDRMLVTDERLLSSLDLVRDSKDEIAADAKGLELLKNSPYKDKLSQAGLFLRAAVEAEPNCTHMFGPHLGNGLTVDRNTVRMAALMANAPALAPKNVDQIAALPLGSRIQVNAWNGGVTFTTRKTVPVVDATEKLPFRVTPVVPYLRTYAPASKTDVSARNQ